MSTVENLIDRVIESYISTVYTKDIDAFICLYDPNVRVFDAWGVWSYEDAEAWQQSVEGWFSSLGAEKVRVTFDDVHKAGSAELPTVSAIVTYAGLSPQGEELRSMQNRLSWTLCKRGHVLQIIHEHTSAPIGFEDMKAILQRKVRA